MCLVLPEVPHCAWKLPHQDITLEADIGRNSADISKFRDEEEDEMALGGKQPFGTLNTRNPGVFHKLCGQEAENNCKSSEAKLS